MDEKSESKVVVSFDPGMPCGISWVPDRDRWSVSLEERKWIDEIHRRSYELKIARGHLRKN